MSSKKQNKPRAKKVKRVNKEPKHGMSQAEFEQEMEELDHFLPEDPSTLSPEELVEKELQLDQKAFQYIKNLVEECENEEQAREYSRLMIEMLDGFTDPKVSNVPKSKSIIFLARMAVDFWQKGYKKTAFDVFGEASKQAKTFLKDNPKSRDKNEIENWLALCSYQAGLLAIDLNKPFRVVDGFFNQAYQALEKLEKRNAIMSEGLYGKVLVIQQARLFSRGQKVQARKLEAKIRKYGDEETIAEMESQLKSQR